MIIFGILAVHDSKHQWHIMLNGRKCFICGMKG